MSLYISANRTLYTKIRKLKNFTLPDSSSSCRKEGINLEYTIDVNGTLTATATILSTGQQHQVMVKSSEIRLSEEEVQTFQKALIHCGKSLNVLNKHGLKGINK